MKENEVSILDVLNKILDSYQDAKPQTFGGHELGNFLVNTSKDILLKDSRVDRSVYRVRGSVGQFQTWAGIPWIALLRRSIAASAKEGYYIVYLFNYDMSGVYISLNQGVTYFNEKYKKFGNENLNKISSILRDNLHSIPEGSIDVIDLKSESALAKGYMNGHICGFYYDKNAMPKKNKLISDLEKLIITYEELNGLIKNRTLEKFNDYLLLSEDGKYIEDEAANEQSFQNAVSQNFNLLKIIKSDDTQGPEDSPEPLIDLKGKKRWPRAAVRASEAIIKSGFQCGVDPSHSSFTSRKTNKPYVEAHHLVPMSWQINSNANLDRVANIVALCPNCHRLIHHGSDDERIEIILSLFEKHKEALLQKGISISSEDLLNAYDVDYKTIPRLVGER